MSLRFQALKPLHMLSSPSGTQSSLSPSPPLSRGNPCLSLPTLLCHRPNTQLWVTELTEYHGFLKYGPQHLIILRTLAGTCHGASSNDVSCHWTVFLLWCTCQRTGSKNHVSLVHHHIPSICVVSVLWSQPETYPIGLYFKYLLPKW